MSDGFGDAYNTTPHPESQNSQANPLFAHSPRARRTKGSAASKEVRPHVLQTRQLLPRANADRLAVAQEAQQARQSPLAKSSGRLPSPKSPKGGFLSETRWLDMQEMLPSSGGLAMPPPEVQVKVAAGAALTLLLLLGFALQHSSRCAAELWPCLLQRCRSR